MMYFKWTEKFIYIKIKTEDNLFPACVFYSTNLYRRQVPIQVIMRSAAQFCCEKHSLFWLGLSCLHKTSCLGCPAVAKVNLGIEGSLVTVGQQSITFLMYV